jgi:replicative DNA helicase
MLIYPDICDEVVSWVDEVEFFEPIHRDIFGWLCDMRSRGQQPSPTLLSAQLGKLGHVAIAGLTLNQYVTRLAVAATTSINAPDYAQVIRDLSRRRRLISVLQGGLDDLADCAAINMRTEQIARITIQRIDEIVTGYVPQTLRAVSIGEAAHEALDGLSAAMQGNGEAAGMTWGLADLDRCTDGIHRGELVIVAGRPGMGKSALGVHVALSAAAHGHRVLYCSLEMMGVAVAYRALTALAYKLSHGRRRIAYSDLRIGRNITDDDFGLLRDAQDLLDGLSLVIEQQPGLTIAQIAMLARRWQQKTGLDLLIIDHLHKIRAADRYRGNPTAEISELSNASAALAKQLNIGVLALCQLSRAPESREDKRPQLSDLRQSGSIEQDADVVIFPYREAYYLLAHEPALGSLDHLKWQDAVKANKDRLEINIAKQRQGATRVIEAFCAIESNVICDAARKDEVNRQPDMGAAE